ncbi:DUF6884 domain-containing protein [Paraburkholderia sp. EG287A]|uniref:DUF6884 domain-containing protein n=1 Tax=Paraburkholderia sp. EG287A TaxID=3237012 RepID=UPI0034D37AFE
MNTAPALLIMACSARKLPYAAPALDLYRGVMYGTYRANVRAAARPHVVILSALHGFIAADAVIEPYEQRMTPARADDLLATLDAGLPSDLPAATGEVMLAGGADYRRVMRAAVVQLRARGSLSAAATVTETSGGIGYQRQQLGEFLRKLSPVREVIGHHPNGTPLFRTLDGFTVGQPVSLQYAARPDIAPEQAEIAELFCGPAGPTANLRLPLSKFPDRAYTWVGLNDIRAA